MCDQDEEWIATLLVKIKDIVENSSEENKNVIKLQSLGYDKKLEETVLYKDFVIVLDIEDNILRRKLNMLRVNKTIELSEMSIKMRIQIDFDEEEKILEVSF